MSRFARKVPLARRGEGQRVGSLELFYDLAFVFAITQVSHLLLHHLDWAGLGQSLLVVAGGPALYLLAHVLFRLRMAGSISRKRLTGAAAGWPRARSAPWRRASW